MFHNIPQEIQIRMRKLEYVDSLDRKNNTPRMERLRQIGPETGRFIALMAHSAPDGTMIEIGTSAGYSALWLSVACRMTGRKLTTYECLDHKVLLAEETFAQAKVEDVINLVEGDARDNLGGCSDIAFCFLDAEKEVYSDCYDLVVPRMVSGGILVADNLISHASDLASFKKFVETDPRVDALMVPIGQGLFLCRKI